MNKLFGGHIYKVYIIDNLGNVEDILTTKETTKTAKLIADTHAKCLRHEKEKYKDYKINVFEIHTEPNIEADNYTLNV